MRRRVSLVIWSVLVVIGLAWLHYRKPLTSPPPQSSVAVTNWGSSVGAVGANSSTFVKQKLSFWALVTNNTSHAVYVRNVKVGLPVALQRHVLTGSTLIMVDKRLEPNSSYKIQGHFILDTAGQTKGEIIKWGTVKRFTINAKS